MKVGSIVECVDNSNMGNYTIEGYFDVPILKKIYEVSGFVDETGGVLIVGLFSGLGVTIRKEAGYKTERFREIQFPPSLMLEVNECLTRELQEV